MTIESHVPPVAMILLQYLVHMLYQYIETKVSLSTYTNQLHLL